MKIWEFFQSIHKAKYSKIERFTMWKACLREKSESMAIQSFASASEGSKHQHIQ